MSEHELLRSSLEKHISISDENFQRFISRTNLRKYKKNQFLIVEGGLQRKTHFIRKGAAIAYYIDKNGTEHLIQFAIEGWWISDLQSFINPKPAVLNVQAIEDCELYEISYENMLLTYKDVPGIESYFLKITQNAFASFQERVLQNLSSSAEERYDAFKKKYPLFELRFPQKLIASYIGVTPEFLSRLKKSRLDK